MTALWVVCAYVAQPPGTLVDRVIAVVDKEVVTESELYAEARIALAYREGGDVASRALAPEIMDGMRSYLVEQLLIASQARRVGDVEIEDLEVERRYQEFVSRFRSATAFDAFRRRFGISEGTLRRVFRRDLRNEHFVRKQMRSRLLSSSSETNYKTRYNEALQRWISELRAVVEIRLLSSDGTLELQSSPGL